MSEPFTIASSRCSDLTDPGLRAELLRYTGNEDEAASILRSLERFGYDGTVRHYAMTPSRSQRSHRGRASVAWNVTAVRS